MKKILGLAIAALLLYVGLAFGQDHQTYGPFTMQAAATATGAGTPLLTNGWKDKTVTVTIAGTSATVQIQGSIDAALAWETIASLTASGTVQNDGAWARMQANISACSSCTVTAEIYLQK